MTEIKTLREILSASRRAVFFGGAGMSTESGIPDFRSAGGIYSETLHQEFRSMTKRIADKTVPWIGVDFSSERGGKPDAE
ncbi:Sir2 family NAD-dependent protein deacetylase, partial [uncultured Selenomonas sp.]|uniref:Sir2 family NAD-dependent protein deacetylase n=1 Tax=uncultured Selenomonas sp. TaxID=159275 RepID=UPI0028E83DB4